MHEQTLSTDNRLLPDPLSGGTVNDVVQQIADKLSERWRAFHCAVYLFNDTTKRLILRGATGCHSAQIGQWNMGVGEGLVGAAFAERVLLHSENIQREIGHLPFEQIFGLTPDGPCEELAIPVLRGEEDVGAIVLLRMATDPFLPKEINSIHADIIRYADTLEIAKALYMVGSKDSARRPFDPASNPHRRIHGKSVNDRAIAVGRACIATRERVGDLFVALRDRKRTLPPPTLSLAEGIEQTIRQLAHFQDKIDKHLPEAAKLLFDAQVLILKDEMFVGRIQKAILAGDDIAHALCEATLEFTSYFRSSGVDFLAEKAQDVEDVASRLLRNIYPSLEEQTPIGSNQGHILFTRECFPSDIFRVSHAGIQGLVLIGVGSTAHVTLLVKSLGIPAILSDDTDLLRIPEGIPVVLNGPTGDIYIDPEPELLERFKEAASQFAGSGQIRIAAPETHMRDGTPIHLQANVNLLTEADAAMEARAEGVGLYRTEFLFLLHPSLPNELDQVEVYSNLLKRVPHHPVTFRTLDAGGDKLLSYFQTVREENPALGLRSTRFTLRYPYIFDQQLRAILRAAQLCQRNDLSIMFPMIGSIEEFEAASQRVNFCLDILADRFGNEAPVIRPKIGTMVELPALVHLAHAMAKRADFFSIGTNDFIQYMLAVDRTNAAVHRYYIPHHPAVLHGLARIISAGIHAKIPVSICGEMGHDTRFLPFFLGLGVRHFSVAPAKIAEVQEAISRISPEEASRAAANLLSCETIADAERFLPHPHPSPV